MTTPTYHERAPYADIHVRGQVTARTTNGGRVNVELGDGIDLALSLSPADALRLANQLVMAAADAGRKSPEPVT